MTSATTNPDPTPEDTPTNNNQHPHAENGGHHTDTVPVRRPWDDSSIIYPDTLTDHTEH